MVTGLCHGRWLLGMKPAIVDRPAPKGVKVSFVLPAHNEALHLTDAVESLFKQTYPIFSVIIVENGSTDSTWKEAQDLAKKHPGVVFALNAGNVGSKAGAINAGLAAGFPRGEVTVVQDADTKLDPNAIKLLLPHFYKSSVAVVCGQVLPQPYTGKDPTWCWRAKLVEYEVGQGLAKKAQNALGVVLVTCGCFSMFYSSLMRKFSDKTMAEDMQIAWELQLDGWEAVYEEDSLCFAAEPETTEVYWNQRWRWLCGFLQCYQLMVGELFRRNLRLCFVVHYMFGGALAGIFLNWILFPAGIYYFTRDFMLSVLYANALDLSVMAFALSCFSYKLGGIKLVLISLRSIPESILGTLLIQCNFILAIFSEMFLGRRLTKWQSGHEQKTTTTQQILEG
jgi:cellulose synthase/poly-beta-1,6-N-acetylglucosamine synthase-like glycosyltransferase